MYMVSFSEVRLPISISYSALVLYCQKILFASLINWIPKYNELCVVLPTANCREEQYAKVGLYLQLYRLNYRILFLNYTKYH
jgi:hypothetical protein